MVVPIRRLAQLGQMQFVVFGIETQLLWLFGSVEWEVNKKPSDDIHAMAASDSRSHSPEI